jgi:hypothetical protein
MQWMQYSRSSRAPWHVLGGACLIIFVVAFVAQIDALLHHDRYDRWFPLNMKLPFETSLYLRLGFCVRSADSYHYEEFTSGRSKAISPPSTFFVFV